MHDFELQDAVVKKIKAQQYEDDSDSGRESSSAQDVENCTDDALHLEEASQRIEWTAPSTGIPKQ